MASRSSRGSDTPDDPPTPPQISTRSNWSTRSLPEVVSQPTTAFPTPSTSNLAFDPQNISYSMAQGGSAGFAGTARPRTNLTIQSSGSNISPDNAFNSTISPIPPNEQSLSALSMEILRFPSMDDSLSEWIVTNLGNNLWYKGSVAVTKKWLKTIYVRPTPRNLTKPTIELLCRLGYETLSVYTKDITELVVILSFLVSIRPKPGLNRFEDYFFFRLNNFETSTDTVKETIKVLQEQRKPKVLAPHSPTMAPIVSSIQRRQQQNSSNNNQMLLSDNSVASKSSYDDNFDDDEDTFYSMMQREVDEMELQKYPELMQAKLQKEKGSVHTRSIKRRESKEEYLRYVARPKQRGTVNNNYLQWDGNRSTFPIFENGLEGTMLQLGAGYLFEKDLMERYLNEGISIVNTDVFWNKYHISVAQFQCDTVFLYGLLQSATKKSINSHILQHRHDKDGLAVWIKFKKSYAYGGSKNIKSEDLEEKLYAHYDPRQYKGIVEYIDSFQLWMEELEALGTRTYSDYDKKRLLLKNLKSDIRLLSLIQVCQDDMLRDFETTANYLRENGMSLDRSLSRFKNSKSRMLHMVQEENEDNEDEWERCVQVVQNLVEETSAIQAYNTLQSSTIRSSLHIPPAIWNRLEPQMKAKINEIRNKLNKDSGNNNSIPPQYPNKANNVNLLVANLCATMDQQSIEEESEEDEPQLSIFHTSTCDLEIKAHFEYMDSYKVKDKVYAISDGGADSCVLGRNAVVTAYTGRYATLVGYDPKTTKSARIPIITAYIKAKAHNGIPVLLKINEAAYNENSPITLLS